MISVLSRLRKNYEQTVYQYLHHQFIANTLSIKLGHELLPNTKFGEMIPRFTTYPATCKSGMY